MGFGVVIVPRVLPGLVGPDGYRIGSEWFLVAAPHTQYLEQTVLVLQIRTAAELLAGKASNLRYRERECHLQAG